MVVTRTSKSSDSSLSDLKLNDTTITGFNPSTLTYTVTVESSNETAVIAALANNENASVKINDTDVAENYTLTTGINIFTIKVTAEDGSTTTYTVNIVRLSAAGTDKLTGLTVADATDAGSGATIELTPSSFAAETLYYTAEVNYAVEEVTVTATDGGATITYALNGAADDDGAGLELNVGDNIITVTVSNGDSTVYTIVITRKAPVTTLSALTVGGTSVDSFASSTYNYTVNVPYTQTTATVAGTATTDGVTPTYSGDGSGVINSLSVGDNLVTVTVTIDGYSTVYTVNIIRAEPDTSLQSLTVKDVTDGKSGDNDLTYSPAFDKDTLYYTMNVGWATQTVSVAHSGEIAGATVTVKNNGTGVTANAIALSVGSNVITIEVEKDGFTTTYTLTINRKGEGESQLTGLTVKDGAKTVTISPPFSAEGYAYTATVPYETTSVTITATKKDADATVAGDGSHNLKVGANIITVTVSAPGVDNTVYTITITRKPNTNANLSVLSLSDGSLSPSFNSNISSYTATVSGHSVENVTITATPAYDNSADIAAGGTTANTTVTYNVNGESGAATFNLNYGNNTVLVTVTAADGTTTRTYTLYIYRPFPTYDAKLAGLAVTHSGSTNVTLEPNSFAETEYSYTNKTPLESNISSVTITLTLPSNTTATINGQSYSAAMSFAVSKGQNVFTIVTRTPDGQTKTYSVNIVVAGALSGTAAISGSLKYGAELTAETTGVLGNTGTLKYQWKVNGLNVGTNSSKYTPTAADIGKNITCVITSTVESGSVLALGGVITKAGGPGEPNVAADDENDVILNIDSTMEFSTDHGASWTRYNGGNLPDLTITRSLYVRIAETTTHFSGQPRMLNFVGVLGGTAKIDGAAKFGETLTANASGITNNSGTLQYQWKRGEQTISSANGQTYTTVQADIGQTITCVITSTVETGSVTTADATIGKADGPAAPDVTADNSANTINTANAGGKTLEYSTDGGSSWSTTQPTDLTGNLTVLVREEVTEATHNPGAHKTLIFTQEALRGTATIGGSTTVGSQLMVVTTSITGKSASAAFQYQ